ncbi:MAG: hypothetical protein ACJA01_003197 [Saprospiraceae bacterium]|jgi:hypothetical protein
MTAVIVCLPSDPVLHVSSTGTGSGTSWADATSDLQYAIDEVKDAGQIWVKVGTYYPSVPHEVDGPSLSAVRESTFFIDKSVLILGGFVGVEKVAEERPRKFSKPFCLEI